jgi:8-oxo-dGTP pyrophosphatase MutT (NUDIX family)
MSTIQPIRPAATVIMVRDGAAGAEIFMVRRTSEAAFGGGMYVFPGGRVDGDDHLHLYDELRVGPTEAQAAQRAALGAEWRGFWIAGIRESFEEAGLLLAYDRSGALVRYDDPALRDRLHAYRRPLHAGTLSLADICRQESLRLAVDRIHFFNRFVTPFGRPRRFDTRFFVAEAPDGQTGVHDESETVGSLWISPREALERNAAREFDLMTVTRMQLETLARHTNKAEVLAAVITQERYPLHRPHAPVDL